MVEFLQDALMAEIDVDGDGENLGQLGFRFRV